MNDTERSARIFDDPEEYEPQPDPHGLQWRDASLAAGHPTHPDSECIWKPSAIYPTFDVCKREPVGHYRQNVAVSASPSAYNEPKEDADDAR